MVQCLAPESDLQNAGGEVGEMLSDFEKKAQSAAVEAVERRWKLQHDAERRQLLRKKLGNLFAVFVLLAGLMGVGYFVTRHYGVEISIAEYFDLQGLGAKLNMGRTLSKVEIDRRNEYARLLRSFSGRKCVLWQNAPATIRPETAAAGVRYLLLSSEKKDARLYEMVSNGQGSMSVAALSPLSVPMGLSVGKLRKVLKGKPFFILCEDVVYVGGCQDVELGRKHLALLL